ncbi:hypothetical protein [Rhodohalobacter barkolensis]|uniref:Uncharacterized protein n=1 Tax=Rhodohalobacter barkolensis TaxID=2053187 RepID=A0A2N0VJC6_9BACT|nr:hypothetical protein [Rhodohalobacter barkolensis]PKD44254.1 hypothetical protein CWD77_01955 [Rhodohalobacter barkolensis]
MNYSKVKKIFLRGFIGFLVLTALVAIFAVFSDSFGETQKRILATTFTISIASICAMACAAFIERRSLVWLGTAGIACSALAGVLLLSGIWNLFVNDFSFKITATFITISIAFAHAFLLALPELDKRHKWIQPATATTIGLLAILIIVVMWFETESAIFFRSIAVLAILTGLETLVIPILLKLGGKEKEQAQELHLTLVDGKYYTNAAGDKYEVKALNSTE